MCSNCASATGAQLDLFAAALMDDRFLARLTPELRAQVELQRSMLDHPARPRYPERATYPPETRSGQAATQPGATQP